MSAAIRLRNVSVVFGSRPKRALQFMDEGLSRDEVRVKSGQSLGVHNCSLDVEKGETVVLMGLSDSGKSTLLRAVNGLVPVIRGSVDVFDGSNLLDVTRARRSKVRHLRRGNIAMVFQNSALLPWATVRENVAFGLELAGEDKPVRSRRVGEQLERMGLLEIANMRARDLTTGQRQRVGLARAFASKAQIMLMDEPFSELDPVARAEMQDDLLVYNRGVWRTILYVTHDLEEAFKLGNRIAIMQDGRIVQIGTPLEIAQNPANGDVRNFLQAMNPIEALSAFNLMIEPPGDFMPGPAHTHVTAQTSCADVIARLSRTGGPLSVVGSDGLIGIITEGSVIKALGARRG